MKILLVSVNPGKDPFPVIPLGLAYVAASLRDAGHNVRALDILTMDDFKAEISRCIDVFSPEIIGFSIRNIDNTKYPNTEFYLPGIKKLVEICSKSSARLIVGGSGFSILPEEILRYLNIDLGIVGEGEEVFPKLLERIEHGESFTDLPGIACIEGDRFTKNPPSLIKAIDKIPSPALDLLDNEKYIRQDSMVGVQTKRGCNFKCIYCTYPIIEGNVVRNKDPVKVVDEVELVIKEYGYEYIYFVDSVFNFPMEHALSICKEMIKRRLKVEWTAYFHPKFITRELIRLLLESGCSGIEFGIESGSDKVLSCLGKNFNADTTRDASALCRDEGIKFCHYLLIGGPSEDIQTLNETFRLMEEACPTAVLAQIGIRIYPGTMLEEIAKKEGHNFEGGLLFPRFYIFDQRLIDHCKEYAKEHKNWVLQGMIEKVPDDVIKMIRRMGHKGMLWELKGAQDVH